jgi:hypothetical protein
VRGTCRQGGATRQQDPMDLLFFQSTLVANLHFLMKDEPVRPICELSPECAVRKFTGGIAEDWITYNVLIPSDTAAIVTCVWSVRAIRSDALPKSAGAATDSPKVAAIENAKGRQVFEGNCESCHEWGG